MLGVVGDLLRAPPIGLVDGGPHGVGHPIRVHEHPSADVARRPADHLDQGAAGAQEPLLVGIEDGDQGHLRQVEPLAQQVDPDQHVVHAQAQVPQDLDPLQGVDLASGATGP